jgi:hypothetical protein
MERQGGGDLGCKSAGRGGRGLRRTSALEHLFFSTRNGQPTLHREKER